eukprot:gb/GECH01013237.1/.p1 GENE.gb/GECH01013237.1/~~gb/GECH01013237.1/.p1  ORF type:complete len:528 (+),score=222.16 gb/GECH01013237.1/:1-1584(+)
MRLLKFMKGEVTTRHDLQEAQKYAGGDKGKQSDQDLEKRREKYARARLRDLKDEEEYLSRLNLVKIQTNWRNILRKTKVKELKQQIEVLEQNHDRQVDRKNALIEMLYKDVEEAEEQYRLALRSHLQSVDELLALQKMRVSELEEEFMEDVKELQNEYEQELKEIREIHGEEMQEIRDIINTMRKRSEKLDEELRQMFTTDQEAIKTKSSELFNLMMNNMKKQIRAHKAEYEREMNMHTEAVLEKMKHFKDLKEADAEGANEIRAQKAKIRYLEQSLSKWRAKLVNNIRECEERNSALKAEKESIQEHFKQLKKKMTRFRESERRRLTALVKATDQARKKLESRVGVANRVIKTSELCRRLETEQERVLPFGPVPQEEQESTEYLSSDILEDDQEEQEKEKPEQEELEEPDQTKEREEIQIKLGDIGDGEWEMLHRFYRRYNKAMLDKTALGKEKEHLEEENAQLQQLLKQYLDGISVNREVLEQNNPLLVIDQMQGTTRTEQRQRTNTTPIIEAAHTNTAQQATRQ